MRPLRLTADARSRGRAPSHDPEPVAALGAYSTHSHICAYPSDLRGWQPRAEGDLWDRQRRGRPHAPRGKAVMSSRIRSDFGLWASVFDGDPHTALSMRSTQASSCPGQAAHRVGWRSSHTATRVASCTSDRYQPPDSAPSSRHWVARRLNGRRCPSVALERVESAGSMAAIPTRLNSPTEADRWPMRLSRERRATSCRRRRLWTRRSSSTGCPGITPGFGNEPVSVLFGR